MPEDISFELEWPRIRARRIHYHTLAGMERIKTMAVTLLFLAAVIITHAITRFRAFFDFSPHADSETAGYMTFRTMLGSLGYGLIVILLSVVCFLIGYLVRRKRRKTSDGKDTTSAAS
jgi:ABC-type Fe3+ transport system permease subunit